MRKIKEYTRQLPCKLTQEESFTKGKELASIVQDIGNEEARQKNIKDQMKEKLSELESRMKVASSIVHSGEEYRDVKCAVMIGDNNIVKIVRADTGEIVETREARPEELQIALDLNTDQEAPGEFMPETSESEAVEAGETEDGDIIDEDLIPDAGAKQEEAQTGPATPEPVKTEAKTERTDKVDLSTLRIRVPTKDNGLYKITLGKTHVDGSTLKETIMKAFAQIGEECENNPIILADRILKKYGDSSERRQILSILSPDEFPAEEGG